MNHFFLIGLPGCGKSTAGRLAAQAANVPFVDLDEQVERHTGQTIPQLFAKGEQVFRDAESACLKDACRREKAIVATGGGIVLRPENVECMRQAGTVVFIHVPPTLILQRADVSGRPLLQKNAKHLYTLHDQRQPLYESAAHVVLDGSGTLQQTAEQIRRLLI